MTACTRFPGSGGDHFRTYAQHPGAVQRRDVFFQDFQDFENPLLTNDGNRGTIPFVPQEHPPLARVVELVDSLASGASARKGVRVRLPPRAPRRSKLCIACSDFLFENQSALTPLLLLSQSNPLLLGFDWVPFYSKGYPGFSLALVAKTAETPGIPMKSEFQGSFCVCAATIDIFRNMVYYTSAEGLYSLLIAECFI